MTIPLSVFPGEISANQDATLSRWNEIFQYVMTPGVLKTVAGDPFTGYTDELLIEDAADMTVTVNPGKIWALGLVAALASVQTPAITANSSGSTRYDRIVARFNLSLSTAEIVIKEGTPGSGPQGVTRNSTTFEISLYVVQVDNGMTATTGKLTDLREYARARQAPAFAVIDGSTGALIQSSGFLSASSLGSGKYRLGFDALHNMPDTDYTIVATAGHASSALFATVVEDANKTVSGCDIQVFDSGGSAAACTKLYVTAFHPRLNTVFPGI
ncbi:MAG: hypothetical protein AB7P40_00255 [Chloroflexota bacterium]